eukprot:scpid88396/ scgid9528/ Craniofacial development protein 2; p97 bucentaur protein
MAGANVGDDSSASGVPTNPFPGAVFCQDGSCFTIATFSARNCLATKATRDTLCQDLLKYKVNICALQETGIRRRHLLEGLDGFRLYMPSHPYPHGCGLAFIVSRDLATRVEQVWGLSDRAIGISLHLDNGSNMTIFNVCAPSSSSPGCPVTSAFYNTLSGAVDISESPLLLIVGDFNGKCGAKQFGEECIGRHPGRGMRNDSGEALVAFCEAKNLFLANTAFCHPARHKTTWIGKRRDARTGKTVPAYSQRDYVVCRKSQAQLFTNARSYGGMTVKSDHKIVIARLALQHSRRSIRKHYGRRTPRPTRSD